MQQIIISGVGGQGVLFITRLLAQAAVDQDRHVLISETHGMAQRGGNVVSHLKVGEPRTESALAETGAGRRSPRFEFSSPLIRPGRADVLLALHADGLAVHRHYLKSAGKAFSNTQDVQDSNALDATRIASRLNAPVSANLVLLAFALASGELFCSAEHMQKVLNRSGGRQLEMNLNAFRAGLSAAREKLKP